MASETPMNKIPDEALDAFLSGILSELEHPADAATLVQVRTIFRKRIPFHLRSYAAALMILRAAGISRSTMSKSENRTQKQPKQPSPAGTPPSSGPANKSYPADAQPVSAKPAGVKSDKPQTAKALQGSLVPLFVSMGKRQRLRPHELRIMISEKTSIPVDSLGRVHLFDNYSFIDVPESEAAKICEAMEGSAIRGRPVEIKPAKKRGETAEEGK